MKLDFDKEIDSLLRNRPEAARKRGAMADAVPDFARRDADESQRAATAHLDVDELSAYAENALPSTTRARYISHLADCESCRKHATSIAMAADVAGALEKSAASDRTPADATVVPSSWRAWLVSFFSPRALRYAMPVLALLVTGTLIFMLMRVRQQSDGSIAAIMETKEVGRATVRSDEPRVASDESDNQPGVAAINAPTPDAVNQEAPQTSSATVPSRQTGESKKTEPFASVSENDDAPSRSVATGSPDTSVSQQAPPEVATLSTAETRQARSGAEAESLRAERRDAAPSPSATPPVKEVAKAADKNEARESKAEEVAVTGGNKVFNAPPAMRRKQSGAPRDELAATEKQNRKTEEVIVTRPAAPKDGPEDEASGTSARNRRRAPRETSDSVSEPSVETRRVAGRRFRRQGGAWVDAEYKSSTSLTNVTRGSEQYRALVADEPELRRVAEQLGGDVIVVWKNRAYRIR